MDPTSTLHQWLTLKELQCRVKHHDAAQMFTDYRKELEMLAKAIRNQEPNAGSRVELMSRGEVLGTAISVKRVFITNVKGTFLGMSESEEASKRR